MGPLVTVLIVALLGPQSGGAQGQAGSAAQTQTPGTQDQRPPANLPAQAGKLPVSVEQIKKDLEKAPTLKLAEPPLPPVVEPEQGTTFKVRVEEKYFKLPTFAETLNVGRGYPPSGGLYNYEIMQMITPPGFRGSEPYTNLEVLQLAAASLASALAVKGVVAGVRHLRAEYRTWQEGQAHVEVEQDLADYNRRVAEQADAGSTAASSAKDPPDKKDKKADAKKTDKKDDKKPPDKKPPDKIGG